MSLRNGISRGDAESEKELPVSGAVPADADTHYKTARKLLLTLNSQLEALETGSDQSVPMQGKIAMNINNLSRLVAQLQTEIKSMPPHKKEVWLVKCRKLSEDEKHVRGAMERFLLVANASRASSAFGSRDAASEARMQLLHQDSQSLSGSLRIANEIREVGVSILTRLRDQNASLKRARKQLWNVAHTLGLSRALLRLIERRQLQDQILVYGGMIFTLLLLGILVYWFRW